MRKIMTGKFDFVAPYWNEISDSAKVLNLVSFFVLKVIAFEFSLVTEYICVWKYQLSRLGYNSFRVHRLQGVWAQMMMSANDNVGL